MNCPQLENLQTNLAALVIAAEQNADVELSTLAPTERTKHALLAELLETKRKSASEELAEHVAEHRCAN